ncbi:MAG: fumarylacetoacetate hydrolase family protein [Pseudobdellovibrionaceae bacterium]
MIQNIWAVGRNYAEHAKELGNAVPTEPMIFLKAGSCATIGAHEIHLPNWIEEVHHEVELALRFDDNLQISEACIALDLTERAKQNVLKAKGHPWTLAKSFKESCPLSNFFPVNDLDELKNLEITLKVNGTLRQQGNTSQMIFSFEQLIAYIKKYFPVVPGDLLLTGTPSGVDPLSANDILEAQLGENIKHSWKVIKNQ